jgi:nucleoid-associated protein YgaU
MGSVVLPTAQVAGASSSVVVGDVGRPGAGAQGPGAAARPPLPDVKASTGQPVGPGYAPTAGSAGTTRDGTTGDATTGDPTTGEPSHLRDADPGPGYVPSAPLRVHDADRSRLLAPAPRVAAAAHDLVTVRRGDSLWSVAARHLGPGASDAEIAHEWPRWFAANRDVVGDDPDLLLPGQQLRPPGARR